MNRKPKQESGDKEMNEINKKVAKYNADIVRNYMIADENLGRFGVEQVTRIFGPNGDIRDFKGAKNVPGGIKKGAKKGK